MEGSSKSTFGSRFGFICAAIGMAVGTGNIWRFPRVTAANGGGAFLIALTIAIFVWAIPLLIAEMVIAKKTRLGTVGAIRDFMGKKFTWIGGWLGAAALGIMFYYSVVSGWTLRYFVYALQGAFSNAGTPEATEVIWEGFLSSPGQTIFFHFLAMLIGGFIIYKGVAGGIEKATKVMIPTLFVLITATMLRGITLPGATDGLVFLFTPNLGDLANPTVWLEAFTQAAWSTGAGWALLMTYAVYTKEKEDLGVNCFVIGFGDVLIGIIAAMAILPTVYALSETVELAEAALASGNNGLIFVYLTALFGNMPGGTFIAAIFFLALAIAAISSLLSMIEVGVLNLQDAGFSRNKATIWICIVGFLAGVPSAYSINFLDNQDWVWGVALLISGLLISIVMMKYGVQKILDEEINHENADMKIGAWWGWCIRAFPVMFVGVFGWWVWQSIQWYPDDWWNPLETFTPGTMFAQWAILIIVLLLLNNRLAELIRPGRMKEGRMSDEVPFEKMAKE